MALLRSAVILLVAITYFPAAPQQPSYCNDSPFRGHCREVNESWHFDISRRDCIPQRNVICAPGQSGFPTRESCMRCQQNVAQKSRQACPKRPLLSGCLPKTHKWLYDSKMRTCRGFSAGECTVGHNHFISEYKCRVTCMPGKRQAPEKCQKPVVLGYCAPLEQFWYYDPKRNDCFKYPPGLCGAGQNMFTTKDKCLAMCKKPPGKKVPMCLGKPILGNCKLEGYAWSFDPNVGNCKMFQHGGCGKGSNHFASERECKQECFGVKDPQPVCGAPPISAYCMGLNTHWYFDEKTMNCYEFKGRWCAKNANGFISYKVCMDYCIYNYARGYRPPYQNDGNKLPQPQGQQVKGPRV